MKSRLFYNLLACLGMVILIITLMAQETKTAVSAISTPINHTGDNDIFLHLLTHQETQPTGAIFVEGNLTYMAFVDKLVIYDTISPHETQKIGSLFLNTNIRDIFVNHEYAYILTDNSLKIIHVADPQHPRLMGSLPVHLPSRIIVEQNIAYVIGSLGLHIIDVSIPHAPVELSMMELNASNIIGWQNDILYLVTFHGMSVISVASPGQPVQLAAYQFSSPHDMYGYAGFLQGHTIYLFGQYLDGCGAFDCSYLDYTYTLDVTDPTAPQEIGNTFFTHRNYSAPTFGVIMAESHIFSIERDNFRVYDLAAPDNVQLIGEVSVPIGTDNFVLANNQAYLVNSRGVEFVDVSTPTMPQWINRYYPMRISGPRFAVDVPTLYYRSTGYRSTGALKIVDFSDPINPTPLNSYELTGTERLQAFNIIDQLAYTVWEGTSPEGYPSTELAIIDITDPVAIETISHYILTNNPGPQNLQMTVAGNYVYLLKVSTAFPGRLAIINISDPDNPVEMDIYEGDTYFLEMAIRENYAYIRSFGRLLVLDISDPANIMEVGSLERSYKHGPIIRGDFAYALTQYNLDRLEVLDLSNPDEPIVVYSQPVFGHSHSLAVAEGYLYIHMTSVLDPKSHDIIVYDISIPQEPVRRTSAMRTPCGNDIAVYENLIVATDTSRGLCVFRQLPLVDTHYLPTILSP